MINANELRIGNRFEWNPLASMSPEKYGTVNLDNIKYHQFFDPIPLTTEILEILPVLISDWVKGCRMIEVLDEKKNTKLTLYEYDYGIMLEDGSFEFPVKHLHQLQNLYWCLTGKELPIELL